MRKKKLDAQASTGRSPRRKKKYRPRRRTGPVQINVPLVLEWADDHVRRTGRWPTVRSGEIEGSGRLTWNAVDNALVRGWPGSGGRSSLARLLAKHRGKALNRTLLGPSVDEILDWADDFHARHGRWPGKGNDRIAGAHRKWSWTAINHLIRRRGSGLDGVHSLAQLLQRCRGVRNLKDLPPLSVARIIRWADLYHALKGKWPRRFDGPVTAFADETWDTIDSALRVGRRGVKGGSSLSQLLRSKRGVVYRPPPRRPPLTVREILRWADAHHRRTGKWPSRFSGRVVGVRGESWTAIDEVLKRGRRGLPAGLTVARLLALNGRKPFNIKGTLLSEKQIRIWAREHHRRTGRWPGEGSGRVHGARGEVWGNLQSSLYKGQRGLPGGSSLVKLLAPMRGGRPGLLRRRTWR